MRQDETERLLSRREVEKRYGISKRFLETAAQKQSGPAHIKLGRLVRYRVCDIMAWIDANRVEGEQ